MGLQEVVDKGADLLGVELGRRVRIEHRRLVDVLPFPGQRCRDCQFLDVDVGLHQRRQLRRECANDSRLHAIAVDEARDFDASRAVAGL